MDSQKLHADSEIENKVRDLVDRAVSKINEGISRELTARLQSEQPPSDTRHLTDTRTRVSTLLEYSLAYEINHALKEDRKGHTLSAVLWNVFPDLLLRDEKRKPYAGLEIKALHTAAEEKSANLSTPLYRIEKGRDFMVVLIWAWTVSTTDLDPVVYPHIVLSGVFDAHALAMIRDYSWLYSNGGRLKAIDVGSPLIDSPESDNEMKCEEGNMGKLMRISIHRNLPKETPGIDVLKKQAKIYADFQKLVIQTGIIESFKELCIILKAKFFVIPESAESQHSNKIYGAFADGRTIGLATKERGTIRGFNNDFVLSVGTKLDWLLYKKDSGGYSKLKEGKKLESSYMIIDGIITSGQLTDVVPDRL